jgi:hypothetical protein
VSETDLAIMRRIDRLHLECPFAGSRMLRGLLAGEGCKIGRRHVKTLMRRMGIEALYRRPALPRYGRTASDGQSNRRWSWLDTPCPAIPFMHPQIGYRRIASFGMKPHGLAFWS